VPRENILKRKQGFVGPTARWLRGDMRNLTMDKLSRRQLERHGLFDPQTVSTILEEHYSGKETNDTLIWSLLIFQEWFDRYLS